MNTKWTLAVTVLLAFVCAGITKEVVDVASARFYCPYVGLKGRSVYMYAHIDRRSFGEYLKYENPLGHIVYTCTRFNETSDYNCHYNESYSKVYSFKMDGRTYSSLTIKSFVPGRDNGVWYFRGLGYKLDCYQRYRKLSDLAQKVNSATLPGASRSAGFLWIAAMLAAYLHDRVLQNRTLFILRP